MMMGKEKEELQQLREEKAQMDADKEELLRLRLEVKNRTTVLAELERLRQELESERAGREQERKQYEDRIRKQEQYIERSRKRHPAKSPNSWPCARNSTSVRYGQTFPADRRTGK